MVNLPAGMTTISGQSGQSRKTVPGPRCEAALEGADTAFTVKMAAVHNKIKGICFIVGTILKSLYVRAWADLRQRY
jgi:hypothetical protein